MSKLNFFLFVFTLVTVTTFCNRKAIPEKPKINSWEYYAKKEFKENYVHEWNDSSTYSLITKSFTSKIGDPNKTIHFFGLFCISRHSGP